MTAAHKLNILVLYDDRSTFIKAIEEHVDSFRKFSRHNVFYLPATGTFPEFGKPISWDFSQFDVIIQHYSVRVAYEQYFNKTIVDALTAYDGLKMLFLQDEYEGT